MSRSSEGRVDRRRLIQGAAAGTGTLAGGASLFALARAAAPALQEGGCDFGPIKIGAALPVTGFLASDGQEMQRGLELAIEEATAATSNSRWSTPRRWARSGSSPRSGG
jgi:branched-chain amino acid transport system substrate-binding protein